MSKREYKSNVFSMLLEEKDKALAVYNALNGTDYKDENMVETIRLGDSIILTMRNDAAFLLKSDLSFYEQQSSYNPNMPLRFLFYLSDALKKLIKHKDLLGRKVVKLPAPQFVVFYNGTEERPAVEKLCLSHSFMKEAKENSVELVCTVYNINKGKNDELLERCRVLKDYMIFNDKVRKKIEHYIGCNYSQKEAIEKAIDEAIRECIDEDVLRDFFIRRGNEVREVAALDYTWKRREKLIARDSREEGIEIGRQSGLREGEIKGRREGEAKGRREGEIYTMFKRMHMPVEEISKELGLDVEYVKGVIETIWGV